MNAIEARAASALAQVSIFDALRAIGHEVREGKTQQIRCPIHADRTPSARVYADENKVYCFTCAKRWDAIDLVRLKYGLTFETAVEWLERNFQLPPASANVQAVVRAQLKKPPMPDPEPTFKMVEAELIRVRDHLGANRYERALLAIDLAKYRLTHGEIEYDVFQGVMQQALRLAAGATDVEADHEVRRGDDGLGGAVGGGDQVAAP